MTRIRTDRPPHAVRRVATSLAAACIVVVASVVPVGAAGPGAASTPAAPKTLPASATKHACGTPAKRHLRCHAIVRTDLKPHAAREAALNPAVVAGYTPADLQDAYALTSAAAAGGAGATVAVVDAYDDPTAESDLAQYRAHFGLPSCTTANGCFRKVDQSGGVNYPGPDPDPMNGWAEETALDLAMVSAICPNCRILLVEAYSSDVTDLGTAVNRAVAMGAKYVSNSFGGAESPVEAQWDAAWFNHPGTVITASTGDVGYGVQFPAASPHVIAVGGTSLYPPGNGSGWTEAAWPQAGSGCSYYEPKPWWQNDLCSMRTVADVSAVADPATGVAIYCSTGADCGGWIVVGGTSASAPIVAATYALAGTPVPGSYPAADLYHRGGLTDVVGGSNGTCGAAYLCNGVAGYDGPTGLGTPNGTAPFTPPVAPGAPTAVSAAIGGPILGSMTVNWSPPASDGGSQILSYTATAYDGATSAPLNLSCTSKFSQGLHNTTTSCWFALTTTARSVAVRVTATTIAGTGPPSDASAVVALPTAPSAAVSALPTWSLASSVAVSWSGAAGTNPIAGYSVRYRRAAWNGGFGGFVSWLAGTTATSGRLAVAPGSTYCVSVMAADSAGYPSAWSPERCTAIPLDDRALVRYGSWGAGTGSAYYRGTYVRASAYGARAVRASVQARRIAIVATVCPTCGSVRVYWGSTLLRTVSLYSRTTVNRRVIAITTFSGVRSGTVTLKLSTSGRRVVLDGLAISRV